MEQRTRVLMILAGALVVGFAGYRVLFLPWDEKRRKLDKDILAAKRDLGVAKAFLAKRGDIEREWTRTESEVRDDKRPILKSSLESYVRQEITDKAIHDNSRLPSVTPKDHAEQVGDFQERIVDAKGARFKAQEFVDFLYKLYTAREFVKMRTLSVTARDDGERVVDFSVSTIEWAPVVTRGKP